MRRVLFGLVIGFCASQANPQPLCGPAEAEFGSVGEGFCAPLNSAIVVKDASIGCAHGVYSTTGTYVDDEGVTRNWRTYRITGKPKPHVGLDLEAPTGEPIYAALEGTLYQVEDFGDSSLGRVVNIKHADGTIGRYAHLSEEGFEVFVKMEEDSFIAQKQIVGHVGISGNADPRCPHLHLEVRAGESWRWKDAAQTIRARAYTNETIDPLEWLDQ
ncbi:MAG: M23 family metallopeptidase [Pseudomonadota bacterium]